MKQATRHGGYDGRKGNMYNVDDKVVTLWRGEYTKGRIIEVVHSHCYRVRLTSGEVAYRLESDLEKDTEPGR